MKCRLSFVALAVASIAIEDRLSATTATATTVGGGAAAAGLGGSGGTGANWFLKNPDGSSQGPYGLAQLLDWSNAGYVPPDSQVRWGMGGAPQPLSNVLRNHEERRGSFVGNAPHGGYRAAAPGEDGARVGGFFYRPPTPLRPPPPPPPTSSPPPPYVPSGSAWAQEGGRRGTQAGKNAGTCLTPVGAARVLARAVGVLPLVLWWLSSAAMGALPATGAWFGFRLLAKLPEVAAGPYIAPPAEFAETQLAFSKLSRSEIGVGLALVLLAGIEQGWLRPVARKRSAALAHRALAHVYVAGGRVDDRPSAAEFRELSLAPWAFTSEAMKLVRALTGVAAAVAFLHLVWPGRGPAALGAFHLFNRPSTVAGTVVGNVRRRREGGAAVVLLIKSLSLWLSEEPDRAADGPHAAFAEELASFTQGGAAASSEAEARSLRQVLLERRLSLLEAAFEGLLRQGTWHRRGAAAFVPTSIRGLMACAAGGLGVAYALLATVEELVFHFGGDRIMLAAAQTWLAHASLHKALRCLGQLAILRPSAARMNALILQGTDGPYPETGFARKGRDSGPATKGGWTNDGPEVSDGLRLEGISFTPPGSKMPALSGIDLHAPAGSVVTVVGEAGAGKVVLVASQDFSVSGWADVTMLL